MNDRLTIIISASLTLLIPLFFFTLTPNFISTPKEIILTISLLILIISTLVHTLVHKKINLPSSNSLVPLLLFVATILISLAFNPEGRPEAISSRGLSLILLPFLSIFIASNMSTSFRQLLTRLLIGSSSLLALHSLLSLTFLHNSPYVPSYMQNISFTPTGNYTTTLIIIFSGVAGAIAQLKAASSHIKPILALPIFLNTVAAVAIISLMLPGASLAPSLISYTASWSIALDALKSLRSLFFGIGLSNYSLLYSAVKPVSLNLTSLWNALPSTATSELLTLLPTAGILTTASLLFLMFKSLLRSFNTPLFIANLLIILSFFIIPATLPLYFIFFLLYSLSENPREQTHNLSPLTSQALATGLGLIAIIISYYTFPSFISEYYMRRAQLALESSDSQKVYDLHLKAIKVSPKITSYHLSFAEINFRLASALSQKESLTDTDRDTITRLIQQSIQSGKNAIELRPNDSRTWLTVAKIYQNLINIADGADNFAEQTFARALSLDRANPQLHLEYSTLLSQLSTNQKDQDQSKIFQNRAISSMQTAIQLKPNYANAYYNLAKLYETSGDLPRAIVALQEGLKHLDNTSSDYQQALTELENLKAKAPSPSPRTSLIPSPSPIELTTPSPLPSPLDGGPIELPATQ